MATQVLTAHDAEAAPGGTRPRRMLRPRTLALGTALGLIALLTGDGGGRAATNAVQGIDPLEILNLQVRPNVVFLVDSSQEMALTPDGTRYVGGDDPRSRFYQVKQAIREIVTENDGKASFGIVDMNADQTQLALNLRGPLVYVSADAQASEWAGFFNNIQPTFTDYDGDPDCPVSGVANTPCSKEVFFSFNTRTGGFGVPYQGLHFLQSRLFRNGVVYDWNHNPVESGLQTIGTVDCAALPPPAGLLGDDADEFNDGTETRACFQIIDPTNGTGRPTTYYLTSPTYGVASAGNICDGTTAGCLVTPVPACTAPSNLSSLRSALRLQLPLVPDASIPTPIQAPGGLPSATPPGPATDLIGTQPNAAGGMQIGTPRVLLRALTGAAAHYTSTVFPARPAAVDGFQKNFVIVITSGPAVDGDPAALAATMFGAGTAPNSIQTMVVAFSGVLTAGEQTALDALQSAGTGGRHTVAFGAATPDELKSSLNFAFSETIATGTFSTESSVTESIYEYAALAGAFDPRDPDTRYRGRVPVILQSSFDMPGFVGHVRAFVNQGGAAVQVWDAGAKLAARVWNGSSSAGMCPGIINGSAMPTGAQYAACIAFDPTPPTFDQLRGSIPTAPRFTPTGLIQRRIFTTADNGVFPYASSGNATFEVPTLQSPIPLWPPSDAVAPADDTTAGFFDAQLGIAALSFTELESEFGACLNVPVALVAHACNNADPLVRLARARREAREHILAYMAGAQVAQTSGLPSRNPTGDVVYVAKFAVLAESTLGVPAVVPPPLEARPLNHTAEYLVFRDGLRDTSNFNVGGSNAADSGVGLRNPDKNLSAADDGTGDSGGYEPLMSVVYHAANDMLHAFRAGPNGSLTAPLSCTPSATTDCGGEELWGFVPFDQLGRLRERMQGQGRSPHAYMLAASVRFSDVFVPGNWTGAGRNFLGRWRTVLVIGRGIAGQHYTAIDITAPGRFTRMALDTSPGYPIWSRGNPDAAEPAYARMGQTWSVPAMAAVPPIDFFGREFAMFVGSGYDPGPSPSGVGKTFYALDSLTGDVLHAPAVPDSTSSCNTIDTGEICPVPNALVANAAAYVPAQLAPGFVGNPAASTASLVYIGDLHGRVWKFITSSPGLGMVKVNPDGPSTATCAVSTTDPACFADDPDQPIGTAVALLNINGTPHVYYETGNDRRVIAPRNFRFLAVRDDGADVNPGVRATGLFRFDLENAFAGFRGTAQPATAFNINQLGRAFFIGTIFNDQNVPGGNCKPDFDSVLFAVGAVSGSAVYDLDNSGAVGAGEREIKLQGTRVNAIRGALGQIVLDQGEVSGQSGLPGDSHAPAPPPPPADAGNANEGSSGEVIVKKLKSGSHVCR